MARSCGEDGKGLGSEIQDRCGDRVQKPNSGVLGNLRKRDARKAVWAFVSAKSIAGGTGTFWIKGKGQKPKKKIKNQGFWGLGVRGV